MAQNFLYMFEFVVDDLLITRQNLCAPEEYPTCCEISFRSSVFVSICDREYGRCADPCQQKCGKCCLFSLEQPVSDKDRVHIHVYKKKTDRCKFLIGIAELAVKPIFDRVNENFNAENPNWERILERHLNSLPDIKSPPKNNVLDCYSRGEDRREQLCPTSELSKRLLPLFNLGKIQTGNIVLIMRLVCNGPAIVAKFPFGRMCSRNPKSPDQKMKDCTPRPPCPGMGGGAQQASSNGQGSCPPCPSKPGGSKGRGKCGQSGGQIGNLCVQEDPCEKDDDDIPKCLRYFACNIDKMCPCDTCEDEFDRCDEQSKPKGKSGKGGKNGGKTCCGSGKRCNGGRQSGGGGAGSGRQSWSGAGAGGVRRQSGGGFGRQSGGGCACCMDLEQCSPCNPCNPCDSDADDPCDDGADAGCTCEECAQEECGPCPPQCVCECECSKELQPCFIQANEREPGPEAYDEFEACLNGSGLTIRVLKDTHQVESVDDGRGGNDGNGGGGGNDNGADRVTAGNGDIKEPSCMNELLQRSQFARNHIKRRTGGHILNHPNIPEVRANIKYSGNDTCGSQNYYVPFANIKEKCEIMGGGNVDKYRKAGGGVDSGGDGPSAAPAGPDNLRSACLQVSPNDIKDAMKGVNTDTRKKGIEVCYKTCDDTDSDVFIVKLGSKGKSQKKKNTIEIELRTPKMPSTAPVTKVTTETYVTEALLSGGGGKKGKKGKKGKGKKGKKK